MRRTHHKYIRFVLILFALAAFGVGAAQQSAGTTTVSLQAARPGATFDLEWRDPATGMPVMQWDIGTAELGVTSTLDFALWVQYSNLNPHAKNVRVALEHSTWDDTYDFSYGLFSDAGAPLGEADLGLFDALPAVEFDNRAYGKGSGYWPMRSGATNLSAAPAFIRVAVTPTADAWEDLNAELVATLLIE